MAFMLCKKMSNMGLHEEPTAFINKWGEISLTKSAQKLAGVDTAMYVRFFYDRDRKLFAIEAADKFLDASINITNRKRRGKYLITNLLKPFGVNIEDIIGSYRVTREKDHNLTVINLNT